MISLRARRFGVLAAGLLASQLVVLAAGGGGPAGPASANAGVGFGAAFRIHPSPVTQTETFITRHPLDPSVLFAAANTINLSTGFVSEGVYVSTNAGAAWAGSDTCTGAPITFHRGDPGIAIDKNGRLILIRLGSIPGLYSHYSTNNGATWSSQKTIASGDQDRAALTSDGEPGSATFGRSYALWVRFSPPYPVVFAFTDDGAVTWSAPATINSPPQRCQGGDVAIGLDGSVNACWAGVIGVSPFTEDYVGFARSTNGGATWTTDENAFDTNGIAGVFATKSNIRVNGLPRIAVDASGGPRQGWIYIATTEKNLAPAGTDPDIVLHRSTDGGATWSAGIRVNQDAPSNGKYQYFPAIHVDDGGGLNVLFYDDRTTTPDSASVFLARSTDGGNTWEEYEIPSHHFLPTPIGGLGQGYQGDNIALTSVGTTLWPAWMDNSTGIYQMWVCPVDITNPATGVTPGSAPTGLDLRQNYPNPFRAQTTVEFRMNGLAEARLRIVDAQGRSVAEPVNGLFGPGVHRVVLDAGSWADGVYFYRLETGGSSAVRKMVLVK